MQTADKIALASCVAAWTYTLLTIVVAYCAYQAYQVSQNQRQIENSFKLVSLFNELLSEPAFSFRSDMPIPDRTTKKEFLNRIMIFSSEISGTPLGMINAEAFNFSTVEEALESDYDFHSKEAKQTEYLPVNYLFMEGTPDGNLVAECLDILNLIGKAVIDKTADPAIVHFEFGQYILVLNSWLENDTDMADLGPKIWPYFFKMQKLLSGKMETWPSRRQFIVE